MNTSNFLFLLTTLILIPSSMLMITVFKRRYPGQMESLFLWHGLLSFLSILLALASFLISVWSCKGDETHPSSGFLGYISNHYHLPILLLSLLINVALCLRKTNNTASATSTTRCPFFKLFQSPKALRCLRRLLSMMIMLFGLVSAITIMFKEANQQATNGKFAVLGIVLGVELFVSYYVVICFSLNWKEDEDRMLLEDGDGQNEPLIV